MNDRHGSDGQRSRHRLARARRAGPWRRFADGGGARAGGGGARSRGARRGGRAAHLWPQYRTRRQSQASSRPGGNHRLPDAIRRRSRDRRRRAAAARHRARGDAGARQCDGAGRSGCVAGGARPPHCAPQPRRDTGRAALGLDRRRRSRSARAHRAGRDRPRMGGVRWPRAPGRRGAAGGGTRAGDLGPEGRARLVQRQRVVRRDGRARARTRRGACCASPTARPCCRSKATPPTRRSSIRVSPPRTRRSARSRPRSGFARCWRDRRCTTRVRRARSRMR